MLYKYTYVSHSETEGFFNSVKEVCKKLWQQRKTIVGFTLSRSLFTADQIIVLRRSNKFRELVRDFIDSFIALPNDEERKLVVKAFIWENKIEKQLSNPARTILTINDLPISIQAPTKQLFDYLYTARFRKKYLNVYYPKFYNQHKNRYCPFCGLVNIPAINSIKKKEYDHILPKSIYPFASVNLKNLAPACVYCNEDAKKAKDVIFFINHLGAKTRRVFDYVYDNDVIQIDIVLGNRTIFPDSSGNPGSWDIIISPPEPKTVAWDEIFCIKNRYSETLDEKYNDWTRHARNYCRINAATTQQQIQGAIISYANTFNLGSNENMENLLRIRFYEFIANNPNSIPFETIQMALN